MAIASPLLEVDIAGAQGILFNITGSSTLSLFEVTEAAEEIRAAADPEANIIFGTSFNERLGDEVMITVIATGFDGGKKRHIARADASAGVMDPARPRPAVARARLPRGAPAPARRGRRRRRLPGTPDPAPSTRTRLPRSCRAAGRAVGRRAGARQAPGDDLRRRRPGDPELPPPQVTRAGVEPAVHRDGRTRTRVEALSRRPCAGPRADRGGLRAGRPRPGRR